MITEYTNPIAGGIYVLIAPVPDFCPYLVMVNDPDGSFTLAVRVDYGLRGLREHGTRNRHVRIVGSLCHPDFKRIA